MNNKIKLLEQIVSIYVLCMCENYYFCDMNDVFRFLKITGRYYDFKARELD